MNVHAERQSGRDQVDTSATWPPYPSAGGGSSAGGRQEGTVRTRTSRVPARFAGDSRATCRKFIFTRLGEFAIFQEAFKHAGERGKDQG